MIQILKRKIRTLYRLLFNKPVGQIIMLHRVSTFDPNKLRCNEHMKVSPAFLEQYIVKKKNQSVFVSIDEVEAITTKILKLKKPFICVTLDDGYVDNYLNAFPIFVKHNIPFVIYITTGFVDDKYCIWWYQLERIIVENTTIVLSSGLAYNCETLAEKENVFLQLRKEILELPSENFEIHFRELFSNYTLTLDGSTEKLMLTWNQIIEMSQHPLCTIAAHSVSHRRMSTLDADDLIVEVLDSKKMLEKYINKEVKHFAFPFGTDFEVSDVVVDKVKECGFTTATFSNGGPIKRLDRDKFRLSRMMLVEKV